VTRPQCRAWRRRRGGWACGRAAAGAAGAARGADRVTAARLPLRAAAPVPPRRRPVGRGAAALQRHPHALDRRWSRVCGACRGASLARLETVKLLNAEGQVVQVCSHPPSTPPRPSNSPAHTPASACPSIPQQHAMVLDHHTLMQQNWGRADTAKALPLAVAPTKASLALLTAEVDPCTGHSALRNEPDRGDTLPSNNSREAGSCPAVDAPPESPAAQQRATTAVALPTAEVAPRAARARRPARRRRQGRYDPINAQQGAWAKAQ
jgi:hypothetical protein